MLYLSLLDQELSSFLMSQVILHENKNVEVTYTIKVEDKNIQKHSVKILDEISKLVNSKFYEPDIAYLRSLSYFKEDFIKFLETVSFLDINIMQAVDAISYSVDITGDFKKVLLVKNLIQQIITQTYANNYKIPDGGGIKKLINYINDECIGSFRFYDGGTLSRRSPLIHDLAISEFKELNYQFVGSTNLHMCKRFKLRPFGSFDVSLIEANNELGDEGISEALEDWVKEYKDKFLISPLILDIPKFFKSFNSYSISKLQFFPQLYYGLKFERSEYTTFTQQLLEFYKKHDINPKDKMVIYGNNLGFSTANYIHRTFGKQINTLFEIGSQMTDSFVPFLNVENTLTRVNGKDCKKDEIIFTDEQALSEYLFAQAP